MEVAYLGLALYADVAPDGKLSMIGGQLDTLHAPEFPVVSGTPLYVVGIINYTADESGRTYRTRVDVVSNDAVEIFHADHELEARTSPAAGRCSRLSFVIMIQNLAVAQPGQYNIRLLVDGRELKRIPLYVEGPAVTPVGD